MENRKVIVLNKSVLQETSTNTSENIDGKPLLVLKSKTNQTKITEDNILITNPSRKPRSMTRIHNPPPIAVARRNARERNRVKQVNNGFATLRQHIPTAIAAAYETGSGRGNNKKLSKVETLRMAVEYIKSLEKLLSFSDETTSSTSSDIGNSNISFNLSYEDDREFKKNAYHLLYEDEENIHPLKLEGISMDDDILQVNPSSMDLSSHQDITLLNSLDNNASLSPEVYSEHSLSPSALDTNDTKSFISVFNLPNQSVLPSFANLAYDRLMPIKSEILANDLQPTNELKTISDGQTVCVISHTDGVDDVNNTVVNLWWGQTQQAS